ncbi:TIGR03618 family F420-dependent PPOX class oxidoreductase [Umezawaea beigongshangensis]|uniref:TIGR03618 family F420-dependent PPOX class oxidoreductase n=1 Tax=Umezawaea beigongshangensis TaxID=2780383 RepID=UPI001E399788|nr:TIGR03618 family F420-dependent PPOX class oxidoreductase [Umezawaea beigongshangensis]
MLRTYLAAAGAARLADEVVAVAVVLLVHARTSDLALAGAVVAAYTLPSVLSGPLLGAWLDRARRPAAVLAGNQFLLAAVAVGLWWAIGRAPVAVVLGLAALTGVTLPVTSGGFSGLVPRLVPATDVTRATDADALLFGVAAIGGPALAGALAVTAGEDAAVLVIALLAGAGGACAAVLRPAPRDGSAVPPRLATAVRRGLAHLVSGPPLRGGTLTTVLGFGSTGVLVTALPVRVGELGADGGAAGLVWTAFEAGCVTGLLLVRRHLPRWAPEHVVFVATALHGLVLATWPLAGSVPALLALAALAGLVQGPVLTSIITARRLYSPADLLGQVSTTGASLKIGAFSVGAAAGGPLVVSSGAAVAVLVVAVGQLIASAAGCAAARTGRAAVRRSRWGGAGNSGCVRGSPAGTPVSYPAVVAPAPARASTEIRGAPMSTPPLPPEADALLRRPNPCVMATLRSDGTPVSTATWYLWEDGRVVISLDEARVRLKHLRRDPRVTFTVLAEGDWYTHVTLVGRVVEMYEDGDRKDIDRISEHYTGKPYADRVNTRVTAEVEVDRWHGWGAMKDNDQPSG